MTLKSWANERVVEPLKSYVQQGAEPKTLARSAAVGFVIGINPIIGVGAALSVAAVYLSRGLLHGPMTLLANFVSVPVEFAMIVPYMRIGEWMRGAPKQDLAPTSIKDLIFKAPGQALVGVGHAMLAWTLTAPFVIALISFALTPAFALLRKRLMRRTSSGVGIELPGTPDATQRAPLLQPEADGAPVLRRLSGS